MKEITDPELLEKLNKKEVTDPNLIAQLEGKPVEPPPQTWQQTVSGIQRPVVEGLGMLGGGLVGAPIAPPAGAIAGGTLGYMGGSQIADIIDQALGVQKPRTLGEEAQKQLEAAKTGIVYSAGGEIAGKAIPLAAQGAGWVGKQGLGFLTGKGPSNIQASFRGGEAFTKGIRGETGIEDVWSEVKTGVQQVRLNRATEYRSDLIALKSAKNPADVSPIGNELNSLLKDYNLTLGQGNQVIPTGQVTKLYKSEMNNIQEIVDDYVKIASNPKAQTPEQLDIWKQKLDNFYSPNKDSRAFVERLRNSVKNVISKEVPEYPEMMAKYSKSMNFEKELEQAFTGKGGRAAVDTGLRKLTRTMLDEPEYRRELLRSLGSESGKDLEAMIAGVSMNPMIPAGLVGRSLGAAEIYALLLGNANPKIGIMLTMGSPRIVGEFLSTLMGPTYRAVTSTLPKSNLGALGPALFESPSSEQYLRERLEEKRK